MKIQRIQIRGLRGLRTIDIPFPRTGPLVITGGSGSGKTSVLEAIVACKEARAPYGARPSGRDWPGDGAIEVVWLLDAAERAAAETAESHAMSWSPRDPLQVLDSPGPYNLFSSYSRSKAVSKLEYFHAPRDIPLRSSSTFGNESAFKTTRLQQDDRKYAWIRSYLERAEVDHAARLTGHIRDKGVVFAGEHLQPASAGFASTLGSLSSRLKWLGLVNSAEPVKAMFARPRAPDAELSQLTWAERMLVLYAATYEALGLARSVVLVDLPELAVHPAEQAELFRALCGLSTTMQIIATTQSPAILRSLTTDQIFVLEDP